MAQVRTAVVGSIAGATSSVFLWSIAATVLVPVLALFIREVALRGSGTPERTLVAQEG